MITISERLFALHDNVGVGDLDRIGMGDAPSTSIPIFVLTTSDDDCKRVHTRQMLHSMGIVNSSFVLVEVDQTGAAQSCAVGSIIPTLLSGDAEDGCNFRSVALRRLIRRNGEEGVDMSPLPAISLPSLQRVAKLMEDLPSFAHVLFLDMQEEACNEFAAFSGAQPCRRSRGSEAMVFIRRGAMRCVQEAAEGHGNKTKEGHLGLRAFTAVPPVLLSHTSSFSDGPDMQCWLKACHGMSDTVEAMVVGQLKKL